MNRKSELAYPLNIVIEEILFHTEGNESLTAERETEKESTIKKLQANPLLTANFEYVISTALSARTVEIVHMYFRDGLSMSAIADRCMLSNSRIGQIINKACRILRYPKHTKCITMGVAEYYSQKCYQEGYEEGHKIGYNEGYKEACKETLENAKIYLTGLPEIPVAELDLSVRTYNSLKRSGIENLKQLAALSPTEITQIRNLGKTCFEEIVNVLEEYGCDTKEHRLLLKNYKAPVDKRRQCDFEK